MRGSQSLSAGGVEGTVGRIVIHQGFAPNRIGSPHDIALVRLAEPFAVAGRETVQPQSVDLERAFGSPGARAVVTGWGRTATARRRGYRPSTPGRNVPDRLQVVDQPIIYNRTCAAAWRGAAITDEMVRGLRAGDEGFVSRRQWWPAGGSGGHELDADRHRELGASRLRTSRGLRGVHARSAVHRLD